MIENTALYIHLPFCQSRCSYCSFVSFAGRNADIPAYVDAVEEELSQRARGERLGSIFFGGGTPSLLSPDLLGRIMARIRALFHVEGSAEITLEANPGTVDEDHLRALRKLSVNRLSLGVQSLDDETLVRLGRIHSAAQAIESVQFARKAGFTNVSLDLIYGVPGQPLGRWMDVLKESVRLGPEHLSLYPLTLEGDVPLTRAIQKGELPPTNPDHAAEQYEAAQDYLASEGYVHYEISNWAREGAECRHNMVYWRCMSYLGIGVAAHSYLDGHRFANTNDLDAYLKVFRLGERYRPETDEEITPAIGIWEAIAMGLRLSEGVRFDDMRERFGVDVLSRFGRQIEETVDSGLLEISDDGFRLTRRGRLLGNEVFWRFLPE
ncbi:MAG: radical SAM family heme chaperone HemW [Dehalococcoidia bacterium]|nr:radical SAM family heme chaperone HemW [Dehalococcoidia bacterium]